MKHLINTVFMQVLWYKEGHSNMIELRTLSKKINLMNIVEKTGFTIKFDRIKSKHFI